MVRISGGLHRGRKLRVPRAGVRPTKDMVRLALFSVLGESIEGKRVLDIFAGSGVIGLEAISRGAAEAVWVESDARTYEVLQDNVNVICGETMSSASCFKADALIWLKSSMAPKNFDMIVADPPYTKTGDEQWAELLLAVLADSAKLKPDGLFVLEQRIDDRVIDNARWNVLKEGCYGETRLVYYRRAKETTS
jgi:16S rRNA (guanine966-N2)-methyltransferase